MAEQPAPTSQQGRLYTGIPEGIEPAGHLPEVSPTIKTHTTNAVIAVAMVVSGVENMVSNGITSIRSSGRVRGQDRITGGNNGCLSHNVVPRGGPLLAGC